MTYLRLEVEDPEVLEHLVSLLYHIDEQAVPGGLPLLAASRLLLGVVVQGQVGEDVADLRVERRAHRLPLQQRRHAARVFVAESKEWGVNEGGAKNGVDDWGHSFRFLITNYDSQNILIQISNPNRIIESLKSLQYAKDWHSHSGIPAHCRIQI